MNKRNNVKSSLLVVVSILVLGLVFVGKSWAAELSRMEGNVVVTPETLRRQYVSMESYRDSRLKLPECYSDQLLNMYELTVAEVGELFRDQAWYIDSYTLSYEKKEFGNLYQIKCQIDDLWGRIKTSIRKYEFECQRQCGTPVKRGNEYGAKGENVSSLMSSVMDLLGNKAEEQEANDVDDSTPSEITLPGPPDDVDISGIDISSIDGSNIETNDDYAISEIRKNDEWVIVVDTEQTVNILTMILGLSQKLQMSPAE